MRHSLMNRLARALQIYSLRQEVLAGGTVDETRAGSGAARFTALPSPPRGSAPAESLPKKTRGKYFTALAMTGRLHLVDIQEGGPWDPMRIKFDNPTMADELRANLGARRARTVDELDLFIQESAVRAGIIIVCVSAELLEAARLRWAYGGVAAAATAVTRQAPLVG
jgi:hypothetical protein